MADMNSRQNNTNESMKELEASIIAMMGRRFANDPAKADSEAQALIAKLKKNSQSLAALEKKSAKEIREQDKATRMKVAEMEMATATTTGEKMKAAGEAVKGNLIDAGKEAAEKLANGALNIGAAFGDAISNYASIFSKYQGSINARLQGSDENFKSLLSQVKKTLGVSPWLKQEDMLDSLNELVAEGIAYNVEQRAFLGAMQNRLVATFDAFDSNLLRIIRLQQSDTTVARMGMEATLTKFLNSMFQDTSYLSNVYDTVTGSLFEATSQLSRNQSVEFEYIVQKWLGSLSSVGVSDNTLQQIAEAINALGTGDVEYLSGNTGMQNLIVTAANRAGYSYSNLLTQGVTANSVNDLLYEMTKYVQEISKQENQVVRQQYANLFGVTLADMTAVMNIEKDLVNIHQNMLSYSSAVKETSNQLGDIFNRVHVSEMIDNVFENFMATTASSIAGSAGQYITWKILDLVENLTGGIAIPTIGVMGNMVDLETTVVGLLKTGIVGLNMLAGIPTMISSIASGGGLNLNAWGASEYTKRGSGFVAVTGGAQRGTSSSAAIGSGSGDDIADESIASASKEGNEKIQSSEEDPDSEKAMLKRILEILSGGKGESPVPVRFGWGAAEGSPMEVVVTNDVTKPVPTVSTVYGV